MDRGARELRKYYTTPYPPRTVRRWVKGGVDCARTDERRLDENQEITRSLLFLGSGKWLGELTWKGNE